MLQNWKSWCRLCSDCYQSDVDLFYQFESISNIFMLIEKHFDISITKDDGMPQKICEDCFNFIMQINRFSNKCKQVDSMYGELIFRKFGKDTTRHEILKIRQEFRLDDVRPIENVFIETNEIEMISEDEDKLNISEDHCKETTVDKINDKLDVSKVLSKANKKVDQTKGKVDRTKENVDQTKEKVHQTKEKVDRTKENVDQTRETVHQTKEKVDRTKENVDQTIEIVDQTIEIVDQTNEIVDQNKKMLEENSNIQSSFDTSKDHSSQKCNDSNELDKVMTISENQSSNKIIPLIYPCNFCKQKFKGKWDLRYHLKTIHQRNPIKMINGYYKCSKCSKKFLKKVSLEKHDLNSHRILHTCSICNKKYRSLIYLKRHLKVVHGKIKPFVCDICGLKFSLVGSLSSHKLSHSDEKPISCPLCPKKFKRKQDLTKHSELHEEKKYTCDICGAVFRIPQSLKRHLVTHSDVRNYKCEICNKSFKRANALRVHKVSHSGIKPYKCPFCDDVFTYLSACRNHALKYHPIEATKYIEEGKPIREVLFNINELVKKEIVNNSDGNYICNICNENFLTNFMLKRHMTTHSDKRYKCELCSNSYKRLELLKVHLVSHSGVKPFQCAFCDKVFTFRSCCSKHAWTYHPIEAAKAKEEKRSTIKTLVDLDEFILQDSVDYDENIHICNECGASYKSNSLLKRHMVIHSSNKKYKCDVCNIAFNNSSAVKVHMVIHTGVKPYKCAFCDLAYTQSSRASSHAKKMHPIEASKLRAEGKSIYVRLHDINRLLGKKK